MRREKKEKKRLIEQDELFMNIIVVKKESMEDITSFMQKMFIIVDI